MADSYVLGLALAIFPIYIFGLIGNTMVIRIVHKIREMHKAANYLLANLAVSDAIAILTIPMLVLFIQWRPQTSSGKLRQFTNM